MDLQGGHDGVVDGVLIGAHHKDDGAVVKLLELGILGDLVLVGQVVFLSLIHISEPTRRS